jgi:outer membrane protein assembly factor BamD
MMNLIKNNFFLICSFSALIVSAVSCSEYNKVIKGNDYEKKYDFALKYINSGDCFKALPLLEELMTYHRTNSKSEDIYYHYAYTQYCLKDYYLAAYYFKNFTKKYPYSSKVEECAFMSAICTKENAPEYNLDPTETKKAIDELQLFMDKYPKSAKIDTCNVLIKGLRSNLEQKFYEQCILYYKMEKYNSAVVSFSSMLQSYPDTKYREEIMYLIVRSNYLFAINSIDTKKKERFEAAIKSYNNFIASYTESIYSKDVKNYYESSTKAIEKLKTL